MHVLTWFVTGLIAGWVFHQARHLTPEAGHPIHRFLADRLRQLGHTAARDGRGGARGQRLEFGSNLPIIHGPHRESTSRGGAWVHAR